MRVIIHFYCIGFGDFRMPSSFHIDNIILFYLGSLLVVVACCACCNKHRAEHYPFQCVVNVNINSAIRGNHVDVEVEHKKNEDDDRRLYKINMRSFYF